MVYFLDHTVEPFYLTVRLHYTAGMFEMAVGCLLQHLCTIMTILEEAFLLGLLTGQQR